MKNMVNNYSEAEKKVREATSNDPWGPSSSLMSDIADLTYNVVAFSEIMNMIWKRLNDHGKNWRHVYKALTLLDYLIKTGSERVALQCKENIFAIQTLKDFQYIDRDGKDQGINVREKSKQLVVLLKDEDRLKGERWDLFLFLLLLFSCSRVRCRPFCTSALLLAAQASNLREVKPTTTFNTEEATKFKRLS